MARTQEAGLSLGRLAVMRLAGRAARAAHSSPRGARADKASGAAASDAEVLRRQLESLGVNNLTLVYGD